MSARFAVTALFHTITYQCLARGRKHAQGGLAVSILLQTVLPQPPAYETFAEHAAALHSVCPQVHSKLELRRTDGDGSSRALFAAAPIAAQERLAVIPLRLAVPIFTENLLVGACTLRVPIAV